MQNNEQLQADINTILANSKNTAATQQNINTQNNLQNSSTNLSQNQPTVASQPTATSQEHTISAPQITAPEIESQLDLSKDSENNTYNKLILLIPLIIVLFIIAGTFLLKSFGPQTFEECLKDEESEVYTLDPIYCETNQGKIFYQDGVERSNLEGEQGPVEEETPSPPDII